MFLLYLDVSTKYVNRRRCSRAFLVGGAGVDGLIGVDLRSQGFDTRRSGDDKQVGVGHRAHDQVASVFQRELSGALALLRSTVALAKTEIEDFEGRVSTRIGVIEGTDDCRSRKAGEMKIDPAGFQIDLLDILVYRPGHLRQERAQRL